MKNEKIYVDFIQEIKSQMKDFLGAKSAKDLSQWIWNEAGKGVENTPGKIASFQNLFRCNIDIVVTEGESIISKKEYLAFLTNLANICSRHGEVNIASGLFERVIHLAGNISKADNELGEAKLGLAGILTVQAKFIESKNLLKNAAIHFKSVNNKVGQAVCENKLGIIEGEKGNLNAAQKHFENALELIKGRKSSELKSQIVNNIGIIHNIKGNFKEALNYFKLTKAIFKELKLRDHFTEIIHNVGMLELKNERYKSALKEFLVCIKLSESKQYHPILGIANIGASEAYFKLGNIRLAELYLDKAMMHSRKTNDRLTIADIYRIRGLIENSRKNNKLAESLFVTSIRINTELKNHLNATEAQLELGKLLLENKREKEAKAELKIALKYYMKINCKHKVNEIKNLIN